MKKFTLIFTTLLLLIILSACSLLQLNGGNSQDGNNEGQGNGNDSGNHAGNNNQDEANVPENTIFGHGVYPAIIYNPTKDNITGPAVNALLQSMFTLGATMANDNTTRRAHEIVVGNSSREITATALAELDKLIDAETETLEAQGDSKNDVTGFLVYSNGASVAVVWKDFQIAPLAIEHFKENYTSGRTLTLEPGVVSSEIFPSLSEYLNEREDKLLAEKWEALAKAIPAEYSEGIVTELKRLYDLYTEDMVVWLANLYEPAVGGWYHSNSARDDTKGFSIGTKTVQYLPDIENTYVALNFVAVTGMAEMFDGDWAKAMPDWLLSDVGAWVQSLQDPDGFFYHPQWPKEYIVAGNRQNRITRDRGSAKSLLSKTGYAAIYAAYTPSGNGLTDRLTDKSTVAAVSKVIASAAMLWQYESNENFASYLAGLDAELKPLTDAERAYKFYSYGSSFQSTTSYMTPEMKAMTIAFFDKHQNPKNGMWSNGLYYDSTNAIHKIGAVYNNIGAELKYIDKIVESTMEIINFDFKTKPASGGVNIYNAWSCFPYIYTNIRNNASGLNSAERLEKCEQIKAQVFAMAEKAIHNTYVHTVGMQQADGSFGYNRTGSSSTAQACPAAVPGSREGDVNGNAITSYDIVHYITLALELEAYEIPMFTEADRNLFVEIIEQNREKLRSEVGEDKTFNFEDTMVGSVPEEFTVSIDANRNEIPGSKIEVIKQNNGSNSVLSFAMRNRGNDANGRNYNVQFPAIALDEYSTKSSLKFSIMIKGTTTEASNICEITVRDSNGSVVILPKLGLSGGVVSIYDTAGKKIANIGSADAFIDLEIVYRFGEKTYDVYVGGAYKGSSSAPYGTKGHALPGKVTISSASTINADYIIDNVRFINYR